MGKHTQKKFSLFERIDRKNWKNLNGHLPHSWKVNDLEQLRALNEPLNTQEIEEVYFPLCHLLQIHIEHYWNLHGHVDGFQKRKSKNLPFIIGIAGSVAAGKSTTARVLQKVLSMTERKLKVALVTTDGFLQPNKQLISKGILNRKGFPESYDTKKLLRFLQDIKSGKSKVAAPVYSHLEYDVIQDEVQWIEEPDVLIFEGINVLQVNVQGQERGPKIFVSDFFDYAIYVDAQEKDLLKWYIDRFESLRKTAFVNPKSYFHRFADLNAKESTKMAQDIWNEINRPNLLQNISPTKYRANLILEKDAQHCVKSIQLRRL